MCGISGIADPAGLDSGSVAAAEAMSAAIAHRGPDDSALYVDPSNQAILAHRRLSILDLSDAGRQPLSVDERFWLTYNGEVYNYAELRRELESLGHVIRSSGDTEVVAAAWSEWGEASLPRLRGMFALAVWDQRDKTLVLARDPLGIKPIYWAQVGKGLAFASEIKGLRAYPRVSSEIDRSAISDYLTYGYIPHPKSAYRAIRQLAPGSLLRFGVDGVAEARWWEPPSPSTAANGSGLAEMLTEATEGHLAADVPVGVLLSAGFDSSTVAAFAARARPGLVTFTMGIGEGERSEARSAAAFAGLIGSSHHEESVLAEQADPARVVDVWDEPFADSSCMPTLQVCGLARRHVKVALAGDGGDELFGGYHRHRLWRRAGVLDPLPGGQLLGRLARAVLPRGSRAWRAARLAALDPSPERYAALAGLFGSDLKAWIAGPQLEAPAEGDDAWAIRRYWDTDLDPLSRCTMADLRTYLPDDILTKVDRASMRHSLEVRPPLLDTRLVESVLALPWAQRFGGPGNKPLLRQAAAGVVPRQAFERPKQGFSIPLTTWLRRQSGPMLERIAAGPLCSEGLIRRERLPDLAREPFRGDHLWALAVLDDWARRQ